MRSKTFCDCITQTIFRSSWKHMWPRPEAAVNHTYKKPKVCFHLWVKGSWLVRLSFLYINQSNNLSVSVFLYICLFIKRMGKQQIAEAYLSAGMSFRLPDRGTKRHFFYPTSQECKAEGIWGPSQRLLRCIIKITTFTQSV